MTSRCSPAADADQLVAEPGQQPLGAELDLRGPRRGCPGSPPRRYARRYRPRGCRRSRPDARPAPICAADSASRSSALSISSSGSSRHQLFEPERGEIGRRHVRQHLQRHRVFEVGALGARYQLEPRRQRRAQIALANRLGRAVLHRALQHLAAHRRAVALAQERQRHLARTETGDPHHPADFVEPFGDLVLDLARPGSVILNSRFRPSALVSVTFIAACSHSLRVWALCAVRLTAVRILSPRADRNVVGAGGGI